MKKLIKEQFTQKIDAFYAAHKRSFVWRYVQDPYLIVVSEIMLQQTQTFRVEPKYKAFINKFNSFKELATATQHDLLLHWQGLGYNRRALYLQQLACWVTNNHNGNLPQDPALLQTQKGIGYATASSICAFAFNMPTVFIETNIRAVFLHEFFSGQTDVHDNQILPLVAATVNTQNPRSWYYALMDYGVFLKASLQNPNVRSAHHAKQSRFEGSTRQVRGAIIKLLLEHGALEPQQIYDFLRQQDIQMSPAKIDTIVQKMIIEQLIKQNNEHYFL